MNGVMLLGIGMVIAGVCLCLGALVEFHQIDSRRCRRRWRTLEARVVSEGAEKRLN